MPTTVADRVLSILSDAPGPLGPKEISERVDSSEGNVRQVLSTLVDQGALVKPRRGRYTVPPRSATPSTHRTEEEWEAQAVESGTLPVADDRSPLFIGGVYCPYYVPDDKGEPLFGLTAGFDIVPFRSAVISGAPVLASAGSR